MSDIYESKQRPGSPPWLMQQPPKPLKWERPITAKENLRRVFAGEKPCWMPVWFVDNQYCYPDAVCEHPMYDADGFDWFGTEWVYVDVAEGQMVKPDTRVVTDFTKWREQVKFPDLDAIDWAADAKLRTALYDPDRMHVFHSAEGLFERLHELMPFDEALLQFYLEPEELHAFFDAMVDYKIKLLDIVCKYYAPIDYIIHGDDWGTQRAGFFSNEMFREFIMPHTKKIWDHLHEKGLFVELHSCGLTQQYIEEFLEMGLDAWTPQTNNDLDMLTEKYADRIALTAPIEGIEDAKTEADARALVRAFVDKYAPRGRIVAAPVRLGDAALDDAVYDELYHYSLAYYEKA